MARRGIAIVFTLLGVALFISLAGFVALYFLYKGVAKVFGRRAGLVGALILATMPQWYLLAHQTITDMPLVATLSTAMGLLMIGMHTDADKKVRAYEVSIFGQKLRLTGFHLVFGVILLSALPQILYLCSRNVELQWLPHAKGFRPHLDEFWSGSKGNCGLPGNEACNGQKPAESAWFFKHTVDVLQPASRASCGPAFSDSFSISIGASDGRSGSTSWPPGTSRRSPRWARARRGSVSPSW